MTATYDDPHLRSGQVAARAGVSLRTALRKLSMLEELALVVRRDDGYALGRSPTRTAPPAGPPSSAGRA